ncbi:hypothetical protein MJ561_18550 [Klebsiella pneumoniae]|nr:hypothetical protein MJ561_18550 [Klebsiella pneumoniae]
MQTIRSGRLVTSGIVYRSSIFGPRQADLHRLQPALPAPLPPAALLERQLLAQRLAGTDPMVSSRGERPDGVMLVVNIELLGTLILNENRP